MRSSRSRPFTIFYVCAPALTALSFNLLTFLICRMMTGAGIGGEYTAINSAIDELISERVRGRVNLFIGSSFWIGVILGSLVSVGFLSDSAFGLRLGWRFAFCPLCRLPGLFSICGGIPESPRWLLVHTRDAEAAQIADAIEHEVETRSGPLPPEHRTVCIQRRSKDPIHSLGMLLQPRYRGRAVVCMVLVMAQSFFYNSVFSLRRLSFYAFTACPRCTPASCLHHLPLLILSVRCCSGDSSILSGAAPYW